MNSWSLKTPEGQIFGPVVIDRLEQWVRDGRVDSQCQVRESEDAEWRGAADVFPVLDVPVEPVLKKAKTAAASSITSSTAENAVRASKPTEAPGVSLWEMQPHRGPLVLALGVAGLVSWCPVFSFLAWSLGQSDLHEMRYGRRDPQGQTLTTAGYYLGVALSLIWCVGFIVLMFVAMMRTMM